ncbi:MAG: PQQ-dependent sugar dehydrogenase [Bacteroidia bacterium]|nr:PQQ-dependent sugar dehydrogenase [Bacteroidia bacterium]NND26319.1 T9SS type A sorting domain-containing protein [Flavobacteriaceae bacterium]NNL33888.1 T9SS type A sorting domain-containing protein [Flavobacteriaceae bacterium]
MKKLFLFLTLLCYLTLITAQPEVALNAFASGFFSPVAIENAGDDRLFIVERDGRIKILNEDGTVNPTVFLNIDSQVINPTAGGDERGLLGLAFHPNYSGNGFFYVNYINNSGNTVISRFMVDTLDPNIADPNSETIFLTIAQPFSNHNGGDLNFGSDGYLYIAMGDGGSGGDPGNRAQSLNTLLGKILRIDVDTGSPYGIPSDNPFFNDGDDMTLDEIWAYGLRNPWRFSFDSLTDDIWIGDVGQGLFEEIDMAASDAAGLNYGWRCYEGNATFNTGGCPDISTLTFPVGVYSHNNDGLFKCSITGGFRYRGSENPNLYGTYIFADVCSDEVGVLEYDGNIWQMFFSGPFNSVGSISTFGEDMNGEIYAAGLTSGNIYQVVDANLSVDSFENSTFKMFPNPANNKLHFSFSGQFPAKIQIYDLQGKLSLLFEDLIDSRSTLPIGSLTQGMYIVAVVGNDDQITYKKLLIN